VKVLEGIYQLITPFPQYTIAEAKRLRRELEERPRVTKGLPYVLPYLIKGGGETILIDCGWNTDEAYQALAEGMREHGSSPEAITKLVVTHVHPDHYGMAGRLKQISDCEVILHERDAEVIKARYMAPRHLTEEMARFMRQHGVPELKAPQMSQGSLGMLGHVAPVPPDRQVTGGEVIKAGDFEFEIIWTPGHSPGHICLYEPNRKVLFTGDHILPTITPNVSIHAQNQGNPLGDYMRSLEVIRNLDVEYVLPAHEFGIRELKRRIEEIHNHHLARLEEMYRCIDRGGSTAWEVASRVQWTTGRLEEFEPFMQRAAVGETLAHLEYLFETGRVAKVMRDGVLYWLPV